MGNTWEGQMAKKLAAGNFVVRPGNDIAVGSVGKFDRDGKFYTRYHIPLLKSEDNPTGLVIKPQKKSDQNLTSDSSFLLEFETNADILGKLSNAFGTDIKAALKVTNTNKHSVLLVAKDCEETSIPPEYYNKVLDLIADDDKWKDDYLIVTGVTRGTVKFIDDESGGTDFYVGLEAKIKPASLLELANIETKLTIKTDFASKYELLQEENEVFLLTAKRVNKKKRKFKQPSRHAIMSAIELDKVTRDVLTVVDYDFEDITSDDIEKFILHAIPPKL